MRFRDREDAGRQLGAALRLLRLDAPLVVGLPRGGVPVAAVVADMLGGELSVVVARKIGAPDHPEFGIGAIAEFGGAVLDEPSVQALGVSPRRYGDLVRAEREELDRRVQRYRSGEPPPEVHGRDVVVVDDGIATGVTARAALLGLRTRRPAQLVMAAPVGAPDAVADLESCADAVVCILQPDDFLAVGAWYDDFHQTGDDEVCELLRRASP
ncbi:MAG: phosphoribosyltransferase [Actinomycetota bacterium]|nr:phosphoribosyltransferase [Actinomycetota bacterium]